MIINNLIAAEIDGQSIYFSEIDTIISNQYYLLQKKALVHLIRKKALFNEAKKKSIHIDSLIKNEIIDKEEKVTNNEISNYIFKNSIDSQHVNTKNIVDYLKAQKKQKRHNEYTDNLIENQRIKIYLKPKNYTKVHIDSLISYKYTTSGLFSVYIISSYDCGKCKISEDIIQQLIKKYYGLVHFKHIDYSNYIGIKSIAVYAASKQEKFRDMHNLIVNNTNNFISDSILLNHIMQNNYEIDDFQKIIESPNTIKKLLLQKEYLEKQGIYFTPTFVVNNKLVDDDNAIYFLDSMIEEELQKLHSK